MTEVVVELGVSEIWLGVPSTVAQIVEHGNPRIPLRHLIERVGPAAHAESARTFDPRHLEAPVSFDGRAGVRSDWRGDRDARDSLSEDSGERSSSTRRSGNWIPHRISHRQALPVNNQSREFHSAGYDVYQIGTRSCWPEHVLIESRGLRAHQRIAVVAERDDLVARDD